VKRRKDCHYGKDSREGRCQGERLGREGKGNKVGMSVKKRKDGWK
jgi:hypothetical protein